MSFVTRARRSLPWIAFALYLASVAPAQGVLDLHRRTLTPTGIDPLLRTPSPNPRLAVLWFRAPLTRTIHDRMTRDGIRILEILTRGAFVARVPGDPAALVPLEPDLHFAGPLLPMDKLAPELDLVNRTAPSWTTWPPDRIRIVVWFWSGTTSDAVRNTLKGLAATYDGSPLGYATRASWDEIARLLQDPAVRFVAPGPPPLARLDDRARHVTRTNDVHDIQRVPSEEGRPLRPVFLGVSGASIRIGICDEGIDERHQDLQRWNGWEFESRFFHTRSEKSRHGTAVASLAAGNGNRSAHFELRGQAPEASIGDYWRFHARSAGYALARDENVFVTNHSYARAVSLGYGTWDASIDHLIRGDARHANGLDVPSAAQAIPGRCQVWAAGNQGWVRDADPGDFVLGYWSILNPSKNAIVVGSIDTNPEPLTLSTFSSLGPTFDGRIKPDVVAPGSRDSRDTRGYPSGLSSANLDTQSYQSTVSGTSMAAAEVTGILALMAQTYGVTYQRSPNLLRPSTFKAWLIHTATDLSGSLAMEGYVNVDTGGPLSYAHGPDLATGYGLVDARAACELLPRSDHWLEDSIAQFEAPRRFAIDVGNDETLAVTLAWDDPPGTVFTSPHVPRLVNDLDLTLIEPDGRTRHHPWILRIPEVDARFREHVEADPIVSADITPAGTGPDHANNVERVFVEEPRAGRWTIEVHSRGAFAPDPWDVKIVPRQTFSLVSSHSLQRAFTRRETETQEGSLSPIRVASGGMANEPRRAVR